MNIDAWSLSDEDPGRAKRLAIGYAVGVALILVAGGSLAAIRAEEPPPAEDEVIDVKLAASVEAPPPKPPPLVEAPKAPSGPAPRKAIVAPTAVPTEAPPESDKPPPPRSATDEYADGKGGVVGGVAGGTGTGTVAVAAAPPPPPPPPAAPPPPPPKAKGPVSLPENATPAVAVSTPAPPYPAGAKADGITATVVVRFDIGESGEVSNVVIVRGHPLFDAVVLATVRTWRYRPAVFEGRPLAVTKSVRIPFTIKM